MKVSQESLKKMLEYILPWLVLAIILLYSYAKVFQHPYGIWWISDGSISKIFVNEREPTLHVGDRLIQVGSVSFGAFRNNLLKTLFEGVRAGQVVQVTVERGHQVITIPWALPGTNTGEIRDQLFSEWFLAYFFWAAGTLTLLVLRPKDERWFLMSAFDFLTAIWLISGSGLSSFHIWYSALVLRVAIWISLPVYLHLHWVFPRPLGRLSPVIIWGAYALCLGLAAAQALQLLAPNLFYMAFLLAILGSLTLLTLHYVRQPSMRRDLSVIVIAGALATVPTLVLALTGTVQGTTLPGESLALLSLPILPFGYLYAAHRSQLDGLELRVNRLIAIYGFLTLLITLAVLLLVFSHRLPDYWSNQDVIIGVIVSVIVTALSLWGFPVFQKFVERRWLGIAVPSKELQQAYSMHITTSPSFSSLIRLLKEEVIPSLLIRQFVFLGLAQGSTKVFFSIGLQDEQIPVAAPLNVLASMLEKVPPGRSTQDPHFSWIRLALPLKVQDNLLGFWLFGRRDPDDMYSKLEVPILQSFAYQTAIALSNILQTERLRTMYQADINRHERERLSLARELHDSVLSELAALLMNVDIPSLPKNFRDGYQDLTQRLREIVSELRPPLLNYGLKPAIDELADNLMERSKDTVDIDVELVSSGTRYPLEKEQHLFRIVQEACENAMRHSHCQRISVSGELDAERGKLIIEDDGDGFELGKENIELDDLLSARHFGLAGMMERAELIDANLRFISAPGTGTCVLLSWNGDRTPPYSDPESTQLSQAEA